MPSTTPRFPVLEAATGYDIGAVDRHVAALLEDMLRGRRTGLHPGPLDTRPFALTHGNQVYDATAVDEWLDGCSGELESRRHHPSARQPAYEGDLDDPPELRGASERPGEGPFVSSVPAWARVVALLVIIGLIGIYVVSYF